MTHLSHHLYGARRLGLYPSASLKAASLWSSCVANRADRWRCRGTCRTGSSSQLYAAIPLLGVRDDRELKRAE